MTDPTEIEYIPGEDVIDLSASLQPVSDTDIFLEPFMENSYEVIDESILDRLYLSNSEDEQVLVSQFLNDELNFSTQEGSFDGSAFASTSFEVSKSDLKSDESKKGGRSNTTGSKRAVKKLPPALKGLMGEANLRCARGDKETAVKICLEIIRQVPTAPEPYLTLSGIYDEMGDQEKCLQMAFVAAHLAPTDVYQWLHLANMSEELGHVRQAITCYTRGINVDISNMELHEKRAVLLEKINDKQKTALKGYMRLLSALTPDKGIEIVNLAKKIAGWCHKDNDLVRAYSALEIAVQKVPHLITFDFINLYLELLIQMKSYRRCLEVMVSNCNLDVEADTDDHDTFILVNCQIPLTTPPDILAKLIVVIIHLKGFHLVEKLLAPIKEMNTSEVGDLYLDIVDAYMEEERHEEASHLLHTLVSNENYSLPAVWLKYAENLRVLGRFDESVKAYFEVLEQAPQHIEARLTLASILAELNREEEAIGALTQNEGDSLDAGLLYERCVLLKRDKTRARELVMVAQVLFLRHSRKLRNKDELAAISTIQRYDRKRFAIKQVRKCRKEPEVDHDLPEFRKGNKDPPLEDEWDLFKYVCNECVRLRLYSTFQRLAFTAQLSTIFGIHKFEIDILSVLSSYYNSDTYNGYNIIRTLVVKHPYNVKLWQLFNLIVTKSDDARHNRFIMRQLSRNPNHPALGLLHGNNCLVSGTYKYAMHEYSTSYLKKPTALCALLLGLTYLQMAAQKFTSKKHHLVIQALGLLAQYQEKRGDAGIQEAHYNLGRGFHHLGLYTPAIFHYKQVLLCEKSQLAKENPSIFDLSREAAFNLHLIYCQSESFDLARMYLEKYIII